MVTDEQLARIARAYDTQMARALRQALGIKAGHAQVDIGASDGHTR